MSRTFKILNSMVSLVIFVCLMIAGAYAGYALWDNNRIYTAAENVQLDMISLKPNVEELEEGGPSFAELLAINEDVRGWVSMSNTKVDFPILQGATNHAYISTNVYGEFALSGSIFLDSRCTETFEEDYWLLYGHNMENGGMFGDLQKYKDEKFFNENKDGMLILTDRVYELETFACLLVASNDKVIFEPQKWADDIENVLEYALTNSLYCDGETIAELIEANKEAKKNGEQGIKVMALTTCTTEFTDARTIVLVALKEYVPAEQEDEGI